MRIAELANALGGVTQPTIIKWRRQGMPCRATGPRRYEYDLKSVLIWLRKKPEYRPWIDELEQERKRNGSRNVA